MIHRSALIVAAALCMVILSGNSTNAFSQTGFYAGLEGGATAVEDTKTSGVTGEMDKGYAVGAFAGYDFGMFRLETEAGYRENDIDKIIILNNPTVCSGDINATTLMLNGYIDFENNSPVTPYLGGGIGYNRLEYKGSAKYGAGTTVNYNSSDNAFVWSMMAGAAWKISERLFLDISYRYLVSKDVSVSGTSNWGFTSRGEIDYESQNILLGLRFYF